LFDCLGGAFYRLSNREHHRGKPVTLTANITPISILEKIKCLAPRNWRTIGKILNFKEKIIVTLFVAVIAVSFIGWISYIYFSATKAVPKAGGKYTEGIVGQPLYVNPLLSQTSQADSDLVQLVYSGLFKYDASGNAVADMAQSYDVSDDQKTYTIHLRGGLKWQDGSELTADDVLFTVTILQDQEYKSPLRSSWQGVSASAPDENTVVFTLENPYVGFIDNLTVGILPKHVWENISPDKFALAQYNINPIGSGPFAYSSLQKDSQGNILSYVLVANKYYYNTIPYISKMAFNFYPDEDSLIAAYNKKEVMGIGSIDPDKIAALKNIKSTDIHQFAIPRYFALFLNQTKSVALADDNVRTALSLGTDRNAIISSILKGKGTAITSPLIPAMKEYQQTNSPTADVEGAKKLLDANGWTLSDGSAVRKKGNTDLSFQIVTPDWPQLVATAQLLKSQWMPLGVNVDIKPVSISDLQQNYIRTRSYDSLLFGQVISFNPDLYSFWHSSQKQDPGLNLAVFDNRDADKILENVRQEPNQDNRIQDYKQLQELFAQSTNMPATFLYSPYYLYPTSNGIHGIDVSNIDTPSQRFVDVNQWYVNTSRVWKGKN